MSGRKQTFFGVLLIAFAAAHFAIGKLGFEHDKNLGQLDRTQRLMALYSESGFYYSFYQDVITAPSLKAAMAKVTATSRVEHPSIINPLQRFSISFEVAVGLVYRAVSGWVDLEPLDFFLDATYFAHSFLIVAIFLIALKLTKNVMLAAVTPLLYLCHVLIVSRYVSSPVLKETTGLVFLFAHFFSVSLLLIGARKRKAAVAGFVLTAALAMVTWQFSQFVLMAEVAVFYGMVCLGRISPLRCSYLCLGLLAAVVGAYFCHWQNRMILTSGLVVVSLVVMVSQLLVVWLKKDSFIFNLAVLAAAFLLVGAPVHLTFAEGTDTHVFGFLGAVFGGQRDFSTLLYLCDPAFQPPRLAKLWGLSKTLLIPTWIFCVAYWLVVKRHRRAADEYLIFIVLLSLPLGAMGLVAGRFLAVGGPLMSVVAGAASHQLWRAKSRFGRAYLAALIALSLVFGAAGVHEKFALPPTFKPHAKFVELNEWILKNTGKDDVIASLMQFSSSIKLLTDRPIIVHPHFEDEGLRKRVYQSYRIYSLAPDEEIVGYLRGLGVNYFLVDKDYCVGTFGSQGCRATDLYPDTPVDQPPFCVRASIRQESASYQLVAKISGINIFKVRPGFGKAQSIAMPLDGGFR